MLQASDICRQNGVSNYLTFNILNSFLQRMVSLYFFLLQCITSNFYCGECLMCILLNMWNTDYALYCFNVEITSRGDFMLNVGFKPFLRNVIK